MCGIAGIVSSDRVSSIESELALSRLRKRGPDAKGEKRFLFQEQNALFLHRRLSIIDLSQEANQPLVVDGISIIFNGEIYNFLDLRRELEEGGVTFKTRSDTEVIAKLYREQGIGCVERLRGMFAFALYDRNENVIYLARDRMGQKPLYYYHRDGTFAFASTIDALLAFRGVKTSIDPDLLNEYFTFNYNLSSNQTLLNGIYKLPPASILKYTGQEIQSERFWEIRYSPKLVVTPEEAQAATERLIQDATRYRMISDVPLGFFLSGGIDSSLLVALAAKMGQQVETFSIGFKEEDFSELPYARQVAELYETKHHEFILDPDAVTSLESIVEEMDEPVADPSMVPLYHLARETRQHVTVAVNGDGGDELFAGYEKYLGQVYIQKARKLPSWIREAALKASTLLPVNDQRVSPVRRLRWLLRNSLSEDSYHSSQVSLSRDMKRLLYHPDFFAQHAAEPNYYGDIQEANIVDRLMRIDVLGYLPEDLLVKADRMTMANGLEGRSPFLDHLLVEHVARLETSIKFRNNSLKYLLRKIAASHLPEEIINRKKQGFGIPLNRWFREELKTYFQDLISNSQLVTDKILDRQGIEHLYFQHLSKRENHGRRLYAILVGEKWYRKITELVR